MVDWISFNLWSNTCMNVKFRVPDMTCGHCVQTITEAIHGIDPGAKVLALLDSHELAIDTQATAATLETAIRAEGYSPEPIGQA
jgi:copper chaperone